MSDEWAKATTQIAKTADNALPLAEKLGPFLNRVLGQPLEAVVGFAITDPFQAARILNFDWYQRRVEEVIEKRNLRGKTRPIPLAYLTPLLEAASEQGDSDLRELWARLLVNAMDPAKSNILRSQFIETLKKFHPRDALILKRLKQLPPNSEHAAPVMVREFRLQPHQVEVSFEVLQDLRCARAEPTTIHFWRITGFGTELLEACE